MMMQEKKKRIIQFGSAAGTIVIVLLLFVVFVFAVKWFRAEKPVEEEIVPSIVNVLRPDPISQAVIDGAIDTTSKDAELHWVATSEHVGSATRGEKDDHYYFEMKTTLPEIDREVYYYQVWLLRRIPYDFFSLGEMVTDDDGYFVLEWEAPEDEDYSGYTQIIVTVNQYDESADPGKHLVAGEFGN